MNFDLSGRYRSIAKGAFLQIFSQPRAVGWVRGQFSILSGGRMLALAAVTLAVCCVSFSQFGGPGWVWQNPIPQGNHINSISFAPGGRVGYAVGGDGTILFTRDGGFNWQSREPVANTSFNSVFAIDEDSAVAVGTRGVIIFTENGGREWRFAESEVRDHLSGIVFSSKSAESRLRIGFAVGTYGTILKSTDSGRSWTRL
ncbi:MAG: hypothetical protein C4325_13360, partial [Blastocatellia bacterium]